MIIIITTLKSWFRVPKWQPHSCIGSPMKHSANAPKSNGPPMKPRWQPCMPPTIGRQNTLGPFRQVLLLRLRRRASLRPPKSMATTTKRKKCRSVRPVVVLREVGRRPVVQVRPTRRHPKKSYPIPAVPWAMCKDLIWRERFDRSCCINTKPNCDTKVNNKSNNNNNILIIRVPARLRRLRHPKIIQWCRHRAIALPLHPRPRAKLENHIR